MIKGIVIGQHLTVAAPHVAGETIAKLTADFDFSPEWNGLTTIAYFSDGDNTYPFLLTDKGGITEEQNLNLHEGKWECFVWGFDLTGIDTFDIGELPQTATPRLTTNVASFKVQRTGTPGVEPVEVVPASLGEQILAVAKNAKTIAEDVQRRADSGDLKGKDGYTPVKGVDYFDGEKGEKGEKGDPGTYELTEEDKQQIADDVKKDIVIPENNVVIMDYADVTYAAAKAAFDESKTVIVKVQPWKPTWVWNHDDEAWVMFGDSLYLTLSNANDIYVTFTGAGKSQSDIFKLMLTINIANEKTARAVLLTTVTEDIVEGWGFTKNEGTYDKPVDGIPESDLSADVRIKLNDKGGSDVTAETVKEWGFAEEGNLGALRVYPNAEYPVDALAYHAQYDALVDAGIAHRSEPFYLSWDSAREYPIYTYRISPNEDWMTSGYAHNQNNDGSNPLYKRKKIFITSGLHGNERGTPNFLFEFFAKGLSSEQTAKTLGSFDWVIIPLVNPWGYSNTFVNSGGAQVHSNPTYPGGGELPSGYSVVDNKSGYNAGIRRNREMIDINRDFSDAEYTSSSDTLGFVTEEARYVRDVFLAESPDMGFDLHQSGSDTSPGFCSFGVVSPQVLPADEFAELKPQLYSIIDQGNRLCDAAIQSFYGLPYGHQFSHVWNGTTSHTLRNYMSGYSSSGVGNADHKDTAVKYSFCIETDRRCSELGGNSWHGLESKIFGNTYVNAILCTVTGLLNQPTGSGSDVTKDTVRGWGFAYQSEIPDIEQLTKDKDATDSALADVLINSGYTAAHGRTIEQGSFSINSGGKLYSGSSVYTKRVRTASAYAYTAGQTYICADGYKLQMLYYGKAEKQGATQNTTTYTGKYTGWSRVITFPPLEYVAFVIKADDDREITVADVTDKIYKYVPPTIPEPVTDQHIIDVINAAYPAAEGVGF